MKATEHWLTRHWKRLYFFPLQSSPRQSTSYSGSGVSVMQMHTCMNSMVMRHACTCQEKTRSDRKVSAGTPQGTSPINGWEYLTHAVHDPKDLTALHDLLQLYSHVVPTVAHVEDSIIYCPISCPRILHCTSVKEFTFVYFLWAGGPWWCGFYIEK